jgi:hypothetical protein
MTRAEVIAEHFPQFLSQICLCGRELANVADWANHLDEVLDAPAELPPLPDTDNGYPVYARCTGCGINLTISRDQWFVHVNTYDRSCRKSDLATPDRHERWAKH